MAARTSVADRMNVLGANRLPRHSECLDVSAPCSKLSTSHGKRARYSPKSDPPANRWLSGRIHATVEEVLEIILLADKE